MYANTRITPDPPPLPSSCINSKCFQKGRVDKPLVIHFKYNGRGTLADPFVCIIHILLPGGICKKWLTLNPGGAAHACAKTEWPAMWHCFRDPTEILHWPRQSACVSNGPIAYIYVKPYVMNI